MTTSGLYYVYEHWRLDKDECFYVGKGRGNRAYKMRDRNRFHTGKSNSEDVRMKLSKANKGKPWSAARRMAYEKMMQKKWRL